MISIGFDKNFKKYDLVHSIIKAKSNTFEYTQVFIGPKVLQSRIRKNIAFQILQIFTKIRDRLGLKLIFVGYTYESPRHCPAQKALNAGFDFFIGHDLYENDRFFRLPHWTNYLLWPQDKNLGLDRKLDKRYGDLLEYKKLCNIIKIDHNRSTKIGCLISNLNPLRRSLKANYDPDEKIINLPGRAKSVQEVFKCATAAFVPENEIFPGYVTEKIVLAYGSGCIPIAYVDQTAQTDFLNTGFFNLLNHGYKIQASDVVDGISDTETYGPLIDENCCQLIDKLEIFLSNFDRKNR